MRIVLVVNTNTGKCFPLESFDRYFANSLRFITPNWFASWVSTHHCKFATHSPAPNGVGGARFGIEPEHLELFESSVKGNLHHLDYSTGEAA